MICASNSFALSCWNTAPSSSVRSSGYATSAFHISEAVFSFRNSSLVILETSYKIIKFGVFRFQDIGCLIIRSISLAEVIHQGI